MAYRQKIFVLGFFLFAAGMFCLTAQPATATPGEHDIEKIINKLDELYRSKSSFSEVEMEIITPRWQRKLSMKIWTQGMKKTFIRILAPRKEKGMGTLRLGNEMWNYLPKVNKVMKIPPSMMVGSWMGSDFTNDDLVDEISYREDYTYEFVDVDSPREGLLYIKAIPKEGVPVVWGHLIIAIRESDYIPVWEKYYDEKNRPMRTLLFSDIRQYGSRKLPSTMEMIPENKDGHKTIVRYINAQFDGPVGGDVFSLRNLRSPK